MRLLLSRFIGGPAGILQARRWRIRCSLDAGA
jgi:hypothetical protein